MVLSVTVLTANASLIPAKARCSNGHSKLKSGWLILLAHNCQECTAWRSSQTIRVYLSSSHDLNVVLHTSTECVRPGDWSYVASWMCQTIYITNTLGLKYAEFHFCQAQSSPVPAMLHTVPRLGFRHVTPGENFWGRKLLHFFLFCGYTRTFSPQNLGHGVLWRSKSEQSAKLYFHQFTKVFSLETLPLYGTRLGPITL